VVRQTAVFSQQIAAIGGGGGAEGGEGAAAAAAAVQNTYVHGLFACMFQGDAVSAPCDSLSAASPLQTYCLLLAAAA